jgi:hypothetical protein
MTEDREYYFSQLNNLKEFYLAHHDKIMDLADKSPTQFYGVYVVNYSLFFSPIEEMAWNAMRCKGGITLYPQYPVENYFLDFGNPYYKIALELDGKEYHKDKIKDDVRDSRLIELGWTIYRVTGTEMYRDFKDFNDCYELGLDESGTWEYIDRWIKNTGDGVIEAIKQIHFRNHPAESNSFGRNSVEFYNLCETSLSIHKSRRFHGKD